MELVVFRLDAGALRGVRLVAGAGVKSSSLWSCTLDFMSSSSSSDSKTTFLRVAALLDGLTGDSDIFKGEDIGVVVVCKSRWGRTHKYAIRRSLLKENLSKGVLWIS
jgi:hypothetical protein